jgi:flagellar biosynthetic protein FliR
MTAPLLSDSSTPRIVKIGLAVALSSIWFARFGLEPSDAIIKLALRDNLILYLLAIAREFVIGAAFGFAFALLLIPARIAGAYIGQEMGLSMDTAVDPSMDPNSTVVSQLFYSLAALIFTTLDIDHAMLATVHASLATWPIARLGLELPWTSFMSEVRGTNETGLLIAAPVGVCLFATTVVITLLMKASPQFNLLSVGIPLRIIAGIVALVLLLPNTLLLMGRVIARGADVVMSFTIP